MAAQNYARAKMPCPKCLGVNDWGKRTNTCDRCHNTGRREPNRSVVLPAWYPGGDDGGRFRAALGAVRTYGGVLEHPASTHAWAHYGLPTPAPGHWSGFVWSEIVCGDGWVCEIWQSAYGARMRKRTWLLYCGRRPPFELDWRREPGTHQVGWFDRVKPTVGKREASATPERLARELVRLAEWSRR